MILGKEAFDWFDSEKNADFVAYILTRKLTDYLQGTRAHVELVDGSFPLFYILILYIVISLVNILFLNSLITLII